MFIYIVLSSLVIMLASLVGVTLLWRGAGEFVERNLKFLVSLSAGVFVVIAFQMVSETFEHSADVNQGIMWVVVGALGAYILFKFLPSFHHHHDAHEEGHPHSRLDVRRIIVGDGIHNIADGILIASSFAVSPALGIITTASVFFHEIVQETSEFFLMKQAGYSTKKALVVNFAVSSTLLIGSIGSFLLLERFEILEVPLLGISAGVFLLVVLFALIPHSVRNSRGRVHHVIHLVCFIIGICLMAGVLALTPHGHESHEEQGSVSHLQKEQVAVKVLTLSSLHILL